MTTIAHKTLKLIKNLLFAYAVIGQLSWGKSVEQMKNPYGKTVELSLALTRQQHSHGLSGLKPNEFKNSKGMLFVNPQMGARRFWMPDTYFNLDIIFLDQNFKIVGIEKNAPAHPGSGEPPAIYKTNTYQAQYILEIKSGAPFGERLKVNDVLKFIGSNSLSEIALKTHLQQ
jgi:uncharacterized membrane protein (UPF0127 family)